MDWASCSTAAHVVASYFGIDVIKDDILPLVGYSDKNFSIIDSKTNIKYALKIVNPDESDPELTSVIDQVLCNIYETTSKNVERYKFIVPKYVKTVDNKLSALGKFQVRQKDGHFELKQCNVKLCEFHSGAVTIMSFVNDYPEHYKAKELYMKLGRLCSSLARVLEDQNHLLDQLKKARVNFPWQLLTSDEKIENSIKHFYPDKKAERRVLVDNVLTEFRQNKEKLASFMEFILHGDLSGKNILISLQSSNPICLIDFQDLQVGPKIVEVAILLLYSILEQQKIELKDAIYEIPSWLLTGYQEVAREHETSRPLVDEELMLIPILMKLRLCQSLMNGLAAQQIDPENTYTMNTNIRGWDLLKLLSKDSMYENGEKFLSSLQDVLDVHQMKT